jgi:hypothetical protein
VTSLAVKVGALLAILFLPTQFVRDLQLLGGIWIEARGGSLIAISCQTIEENKNSVSRCDAASSVPRYGIMR